MLAIISIWKPKPGLLEPPALGTVSDKRVCYLCPGLTTPIPSVARYGWNQSNSVFVTRFHISAPELYRGAEPLEALHALIVSTYNITKKQNKKKKPWYLHIYNYQNLLISVLCMKILLYRIKLSPAAYLLLFLWF